MTDQEQQKNDGRQPAEQPDLGRDRQGQGESRQSPTEPRRDQPEAHPPGEPTPS